MSQLIFWSVITSITLLFLIPQDMITERIFDWWDKAQHMLAFSILMLLGFLAYPKAFWKLAIGLILYGVTIEIIQSQTGWRSGEVMDALADVVGVVLTGLLIQMYGFYQSKNRS